MSKKSAASQRKRITVERFRQVFQSDLANTPLLLHTQRLSLRPHRPEDLNASLALWSDPEVTRYIGGQPLTREQVWARLLRHLGHWQVYGYGYLVVLHQGELVGEVGVAEFKRDSCPLQHEAGWVFARTARNRGFALESVEKLLEWFARPSSCIIHPENAPSLKLAARLGYILDPALSQPERSVFHRC